MTGRRACGLTLGAFLASGTAGPAPSLALPTEPDLVPELHAAPYEGQVAPIYVDRFEQPGRILYRFDAVLRNIGGTLDLYRDTASGTAMQAVWSGGEPSEQPDPNSAPSSPDADLIDIGSRGARFDYVFERTHDHWHFFTAARYALELPGGGLRVSDKVGFCLFDGFGGASGAKWFPPGYTGSGSQTWCGFDHPDGDFVRMGLSPSAADRYASQREFQWIDTTDLRPGIYTLVATANPEAYIDEVDATNNVIRESRSLPGVLASDVRRDRLAGQAVDITLPATVVAPEIPSRSSASCEPSASSQDCYTRASASGPLTFRIVRPPSHGSVSVVGESGTRATARYTPAARYDGSDSFAYTATDARGLTSAPAVVSINTIGRARPAGRIVKSMAVRRRGRRWYAVLRLSTPARVRGVLAVRRRGRYRVSRRLALRTLRSGRRKIWLGRLKPKRAYLLRLRARDGARVQVMTKRFRTR